MDFVKAKDVKLGDMLIADDGFPCLNEGQVVEVKAEHEDGALYVECNEDCRHYINGELSQGRFIGFTKAPPPEEDNA